MILVKVADVNFIHEIKFAEFINGFCVWFFVKTNDENSFLLGEFLSDAHRADIDVILAADGPDGTDDAGFVVIKDNQNRPPWRSISMLKAVDFSNSQQCSAEDRAGYGARNLIGSDFGAETCSHILGFNIFCFVDTYAALFSQDRDIDDI